MGTGAEWVVPAIISAVSTGAGVYHTKQVADDQDKMAARGITAQQAKQRQIDERLSNEISNLESSSPEDERAQSMEQFMQQLRATRGEAEGSPTVGSQRYGQDTQASQAGIGNYGEKLAGTASRINAVGEQRRNENFSLNRAAGDVTGLAREASGESFLNRLRMQGVQRNPWIDAASQLGNGIAGGMAASGGQSIDPTLAGQMTRAGNETVTRAPSALLPRSGYNWLDRGSPFGGTPPYVPPRRG
jgi:hypothetical protein